MKGRQSQIVNEKNEERNACVEGEEGARQHHARYLEPGDFFHSSLLSASRRQRSTSRIFFQALSLQFHQLLVRTSLHPSNPWTMALYVTAQFLSQVASDGPTSIVQRSGPGVGESTWMHDQTILCCGWIPAITTTMTGHAVGGSGHGGYVVDGGSS